MPAAPQKRPAPRRSGTPALDGLLLGRFAAVLVGIVAAAAGAAWLLDAQAAPAVAKAVRLLGLVVATGWTFHAVSTLLGTRPER
jgi:hypothetical protein